MKNTANYQLNQWEQADRILMADFNADNSKVDGALAGLQTALAGKADSATVSALQTAVAGCGNCKLQYGTYTGTGTYGSANPNTLTFSFQPKLVIVQRSTAAEACLGASDTVRYAMLIALRPLSTYYLSTGTWAVSVSWGEKSISWYQANKAELQMNEANTTYTYLALG